jgi:hypothetical protein
MTRAKGEITAGSVRDLLHDQHPTWPPPGEARRA